MSFTTQPSTIALGPASIIPIPTEVELGVTFGPHLAINAMATNSTDKIMIVGHESPLGIGFWITDMNFQNPVYTAFNPIGSSIWTGCGYGNGIWFITLQFGRTWWSDNDGVSWTESIFPNMSARTSSGGNFYNPNTGVHYVGFSAMHYSVDDCVNFIAQADVIDLTPSSVVYAHSINPYGSPLFILGGGQERIHHNTSTTSGDTLSWSTQIIDFAPAPYNTHLFVGKGHDAKLRFAGISSPPHQMSSVNGTSWVDETAFDLPGVISNGIYMVKYFPSLGQYWAVTQSGPNEWFMSTDGVNYTSQGLGAAAPHPFTNASGNLKNAWSWDPGSQIVLPNNGFGLIMLGDNVGGLQFYIGHYS